MKNTGVALLLIGISSCFYHFDTAKKKLVWQDEFDYTGLPDSTRWGYDLGGSGWGNNEAQYYTHRIKNAHVENGILTIEAIKENYGDKEFTSARMITKNKGDWKYGRIEVRAKLPSGNGTWPALWMLPTDWKYGGWPASGEIDIMEHVGFNPGVIHGTLHSEKYNHIKRTQQEGMITIPDCQDVFHVYAIEWSETRIDFFVDNKNYHSVTKSPSDNYTGWPFDQRFHLILNIAVGGNWGGMKGIDPAIWPQRMEVDYVRVYQ
ncbi:MAG: glycoside hydrolase family 16 protein [Bacteroidetes bacterium]|nr:glycoside hydrolase family 16 protein [Bacteroidota bacterium]